MFGTIDTAQEKDYEKSMRYALSRYRGGMGLVKIYPTGIMIGYTRAVPRLPRVAHFLSFSWMICFLQNGLIWDYNICLELSTFEYSLMFCWVLFKLDFFFHIFETRFSPLLRSSLFLDFVDGYFVVGFLQHGLYVVKMLPGRSKLPSMRDISREKAVAAA